jgi:AraC-like DNA-binding protein
MADLLRACGVAERTLRKHFRAFLGFSPLGYLRRMRLAALLEELLRATERSTITEIAARYGLHHLGRLSAEYARCFGERPSTTLRRARVARTHGRAECHASDTCLSPERRRRLSGTAHLTRTAVGCRPAFQDRDRRREVVRRQFGGGHCLRLVPRTFPHRHRGELVADCRVDGAAATRAVRATP